VMARAVGTMAMVSPGRRGGEIDTDMGRRSAVLCIPGNGWVHSPLNFTNVLRAGDRSPVLRLRQGYGACTLLAVVFIISFISPIVNAGLFE
jgi:hypothetical protein